MMVVSHPFPSSSSFPVPAPVPALGIPDRASTSAFAEPRFRANARAGPSAYRPPPPLPRVGQYARPSSNLNPNAPQRSKATGREKDKDKARVVVEIPIGRRKKKRQAKVFPPLVLPPSEVVAVPTRRQYKALQEGLMCPWPKCDAKLANVEIAAKHYVRHQSKVVGPTCGIRRCTHPIIDYTTQTLITHFTDHHLAPHRPALNYGSEIETALGAQARAPPLRSLMPPPPIPGGEIPPEYIITHRVLPFDQQPPIPIPLPPAATKHSAPPPLPPPQRPFYRPLLPDYGPHAPFWPVHGNAIAGGETVRYSSYIYVHPLPDDEDPLEDEVLGQMYNDLHNPTATSSQPSFSFPFPSTESRPPSSSSSRTAVSPLAESGDPGPSSKSLRSRALQMVPREYVGTLALTVPLADVLADAKRRAEEAALTNPRRIALMGYERKRKATGPEAVRLGRIRRIAEESVTSHLGRTIGVGWLESVGVVEQALRDAVMGADEDVDMA